MGQPALFLLLFRPHFSIAEGAKKVQKDYLNFLFLAASDFFLRFTLGFS